MFTPYPFEAPKISFSSPEGKIGLFTLNLDPNFEISKPCQNYTFWKLDFMRNIFLFFVDRIRGPQKDVLPLASVKWSGTHTHPLYKWLHSLFLPHFSIPPTATLLLQWQQPLFSISSISLALMEPPSHQSDEGTPATSSPSSPLLFDTLFMGNQGGQPLLQASSCWFVTLEVKTPSHFPLLCNDFPSSAIS